MVTAAKCRCDLMSIGFIPNGREISVSQGGFAGSSSVGSREAERRVWPYGTCLAAPARVCTSSSFARASSNCFSARPM